METVVIDKMMYSTDVHNGASYNPLLDTRHLELYKDP